MDRASHKTPAGTDNMLRPRKEPGIVLKSRDKSVDHNTQLCTLRSPSGISKSIKTSNSSYLEKIKSAKAMSLNGGNSSKSCLSVNSVKNSPPFPFKHGLSSSSFPKKHEISAKFGVENSESNGHKQMAQNSRQKSRLCAAQEPTTTPHPFTCKNEASGIRQTNVSCHSNVINLHGDGDSASQEETHTKQVTRVVKNGISFDGESSSSSSRGKKAIISRPFPVKRNAYTITPPPSSSKSKNLTIGGDKGNNTGSSSRLRLSMGGKAGPSNQLDDSIVPLTQPPVPASHNRMCRALNSSLLPHEFYAESSSRAAEMLPHRSDGGGDDQFDFIEFGLSRRDRLYMGAVAGMLREMDRIEEATGMPYEQFLQEADTLLQGLSFRDQHRDMRMDIDNMSYEELLDLEERMGTVSTGISEEEMSGCVRMCTFQSSDSAAMGVDKVVVCGQEGYDDIKCSICQEEYAEGEETGVLGCHHRYHVDCLHKWMMVKNWCPVCKASAK